MWNTGSVGRVHGSSAIKGEFEACHATGPRTSRIRGVLERMVVIRKRQVWQHAYTTTERIRPLRSPRSSACHVSSNRSIFRLNRDEWRRYTGNSNLDWCSALNMRDS